ncbi:flagellar protein FliS [Adhaeretor mobilis]|uniref:Flagellar protein FliS n=2 Tax=Adhaeretor mobilis TaxID=1930276 RepID=A0A517MU68_9BACT|nr:flagellar protein FliS [Adhaeretor mobilis]
MLLDGALRFGTKARQAWTQTMDFSETERFLGKVLDILEAIVLGVAQSDHAIAKQLEEQYAFLFREIAASRINNDLKRFDKSMTLLAYERETWKLACDLLSADTTSPEPTATSNAGVPAPHVSAAPVAANHLVESFSFEA